MQNTFLSLLARTALFAALLSSVLAVAQSAPTVDTASSHTRLAQLDVEAGLNAQLTATRAPINSGLNFANPDLLKVQNFDPSVGFHASAHQQFRRFLGYKANFSLTNTNERFSRIEYANFRTGILQTSMREISVNWVVAGPSSRTLHSFAEAGVGGLFFKPSKFAGAKSQIRAASTFGFGFDRTLSPHWDLRAEYRGIFYKGPDYQLDIAGYPTTRLFTITSLPSIGLVYHISPKR